MKKGGYITLFVLFAAISCLICSIAGWQAQEVHGSGQVIEKQYQVRNFTGIHLATFGNLYLQTGDKEALRIEAEDNLFRYFQIKVKGKTLEITNRWNVSLQPTEPINLYLTVKGLDEIEISGRGKIQAPPLKAKQFSVEISGEGDVHIQGLEAKTLQIDISGMGNLDINGGQVEEQKVKISGSGNYNAENLASAKADLSLSGIGWATIRVRDHLQVDVSGTGLVQYVGSPTVEKDVDGLAKVERIKS
jgi:hypothetical protein